MTYRQDSDVIQDYGCLTNKSTNKPIKSEFILNYDKTIKVDNLAQYGIAELHERKNHISWLVSHCLTKSRRESYVREMKKSKQLQIDVFGKCGSSAYKIPRSGGWVPAYPELAKKYKFYLSFENAKCYDYITEKFFTALKAGMIPVVMGGLSKQDYLKIAPQHSFIHVDDFSSASELMEMLHQISKNQTLYNSYFWWRSHYSIGQRNSKCQLCDVLKSHDYKSKNDYTDFTSYWHSNKCIH